MLIESVQTQISFVNSDLITLLLYIKSIDSLSELDFVDNCFELLKDNNNYELAWNESLKSFKSPLSIDDKDILISFGSQLGKTDTQGQIKNCELHKHQIEKQIIDAEEKFKKYGNLYFNLGILSGVLLVIVLI